MKTSIYISALFLTLLLGSCKKSSTTPDPVPTPPPTQTAFTLTVSNGDGGGTYNVNDTAFIFSNPVSSTQVFDKWVGDVAALASPNEWRTSLKMPSANVSVTATYKTVVPVTFTNVVINGSQVYYYVPATYRGIVIPFHGAGGNATGWVGPQGTDNFEFCRYAIANGYAVVVTESKDRVNKVWDASGVSSVDITNIDVIINNLTTNGIIAAGKPFYGVGMSQGSGFLSLISFVKNYKAAALYCLGGIDQVFNTSTIPTIWNMALKDITEDPNRLITASANYQKLQTRTIPSAYYVNQPSPLLANRLTVIPGIDASGSAAIITSLKNAGYINSKNFVTIDPRVSQAWYSSVPAPYNTNAFIPKIDEVMYVAFTQHKFYKDSNFRTIEFFNRF